MAQAPNELTAIEALSAMAAGRLSAEALTRACLERIAARDSIVHAFAYLDPNGR
jgi:Asp-tRNA(Asn)/Glu-tRNA(Gln) amidotransferase A subunit family amidase